MTFLTITSASWSMAAICVCVVFAMLIVLVCFLSALGFFAKRSGKAKTYEVPALAPGEHADAADGDDLVVVATAIYLYLNSAHDEESGVLTIKDGYPSNWHAVLNPRL